MRRNQFRLRQERKELRYWNCSVRERREVCETELPDATDSPTNGALIFHSCTVDFSNGMYRWHCSCRERLPLYPLGVDSPAQRTANIPILSPTNRRRWFRASIAFIRTAPGDTSPKPTSGQRR